MKYKVLYYFSHKNINFEKHNCASNVNFVFLFLSYYNTERMSYHHFSYICWPLCKCEGQFQTWAYLFSRWFLLIFQAYFISSICSSLTHWFSKLYYGLFVCRYLPALDFDFIFSLFCLSHFALNFLNCWTFAWHANDTLLLESIFRSSWHAIEFHWINSNQR